MSEKLKPAIMILEMLVQHWRWIVHCVIVSVLVITILGADVGKTYKKNEDEWEVKRSKGEKRRDKIKKKHEFLNQKPAPRDEEDKYDRRK
jgi:hypothetical protein